VANMAQPTAEPVEDYDYESLPPNFSLLQNMAAGAFAGIAVHHPRRCHCLDIPLTVPVVGAYRHVPN
jgi:hypothetical protein